MKSVIYHTWWKGEKSHADGWGSWLIEFSNVKKYSLLQIKVYTIPADSSVYRTKLKALLTCLLRYDSLINHKVVFNLSNIKLPKSLHATR